MGHVLALDAPAKLNLYLHVLGRRRDGYHRLDSLVVFLDLADTLTVEPADRLTLSVAGPGAPALDELRVGTNIVLEAARLLAREAGTAPRAALRLDKRLPVAAGLGGGSADAAAALRLLDRLWTTRAGADDLRALGQRLGADVPVCLAAVPTVVRGIGERLEAAPRQPPVAVVLANPRRPLATADVFARHQAAPRRASRPMGPVKDARALARRLARRRNDLTWAASGLEPAIPELLAGLTTAGALLARMSGSGATCFGLFDAAAAARRASAYLSGEHPGWWVARCAIRGDRPEIRNVAVLPQRGDLASSPARKLDIARGGQLG
ncbi:MAG: 4-(cytidine 5'-diphospho)-2-C-methyl-D-erythritol kinase [Alphaproteobacteria bacterium]